MNAIQRAVLRWLPKDGDYLPICGKFYRGRVWTGAGPLEAVYPRWFVALCRAEGAIYLALYKLCGRDYRGA